MTHEELESHLREMIEQVWDSEIRWPYIRAWLENFTGACFDVDVERRLALFALGRFMYFSRPMVREMLRSAYRDHFEAPMLQRIRRNSQHSWDFEAIKKLYARELSTTRFIGVGNPAESGAHLLYYFRQVNYLPKGLFADLAGAFFPVTDASGNISYKAREPSVTRYVFFDDLVGSGTQVTKELKPHIDLIRISNPDVELRFLSLFATTKGLVTLTAPNFFDEAVSCLFELDESFKAFDEASRYFGSGQSWFSIDDLKRMAKMYGRKIYPNWPLGYKDGQLLLGFSHNTPNNTAPIFWNEGVRAPWNPIFLRYDKRYGRGSA
ncbi:phosphoribosyltransferase-like protein [Burkholderia gladioli]|uniref:PRTase-CE domain-containing protein n=1 Tax=Burkholderia gladioli (strain BSR3) TaxID=999541 RepID=F2LA85_BURGS|nr:hypothetical protein [Burkholderia gladioli]AEA61331.1 hypothetical protein bgla_1g27130 [Burkholderia gladioli BSR3]